jgi:hypothetical protein
MSHSSGGRWVAKYRHTYAPERQSNVKAALHNPLFILEYGRTRKIARRAYGTVTVRE